LVLAHWDGCSLRFGNSMLLFKAGAVIQVLLAMPGTLERQAMPEFSDVFSHRDVAGTTFWTRSKQCSNVCALAHHAMTAVMLAGTRCAPSEATATA
jgi:hypothetical protein